jgi:hypothetical protein
MNLGTNLPIQNEKIIKKSKKSLKQISEGFFFVLITEFSELDLDALSNEDYFEKKNIEEAESIKVVELSFMEKLQELNTKTKRGKTIYQCPFCLKFYGQNGMYSHIDAENEWKRRCKE